MQIVVKNVPPHKSDKEGEGLVCSLSPAEANRLPEIGHINDEFEIGNDARDSKGCIFQHRIYEITNCQKAPEYIYMWVKNRQGFTAPMELLLEQAPFGIYPVYSFSSHPLMG